MPSGGAGPTHASAIARELSIPKVIVPLSPGVFSAWGMLMADLRHDFTQTYVQLMDKADVDTLNNIFRDLESQIAELFERENIPSESITMTYEMGLRYKGQEHTLSVPAPATLTEEDKAILNRRFDEVHQKVYGQNAPEEPKEIVSPKVIGIGQVEKPKLKTLKSGAKTPPEESHMGKRNVYVGDNQYMDFGIYRRDKLLSGNLIQGPAIIEEPTSTTVVEENQTCSVNEYGNLIIRLK